MKLSTLLKAYAEEAKKSKQIANERLNYDDRLKALQKIIKRGQKVTLQLKKKIAELDKNGNKIGAIFLKGILRIVTLMRYLLLKASMLLIDAKYKLKHITDEIRALRNRRREELINKYKQELERAKKAWQKTAADIFNRDFIERELDFQHHPDQKIMLDRVKNKLELEMINIRDYERKLFTKLEKSTLSDLEDILSDVWELADRLERIAKYTDHIKEYIRSGKIIDFA